MVFTQIPANLSTVNAPLVYAFEGAPANETLIQLFNGKTNTVLATMRLYNTPRGQIDIAPLLRRYLKLAPPTEAYEGVIPAQTMGAEMEVWVVCAGVASEKRRFHAGTKTYAPLAFYSSRPTRRILYENDVDYLFTVHDPRAKIRVTRGDGKQPQRLLQGIYTPQAGQLVIPVVQASLFKGAGTLEVEVVRDGTVVWQNGYNRLEGGMMVDAIHYTLVPHTGTLGRVAWRSEKGGYELYTFPVELTSRVSGSGKQIRVVRSAYEPQEMIESLAKIASAAQVWIVPPGLWGAPPYQEVRVLPNKELVKHHGSLRCVELELEIL